MRDDKEIRLKVEQIESLVAQLKEALGDGDSRGIPAPAPAMCQSSYSVPDWPCHAPSNGKS